MSCLHHLPIKAQPNLEPMGIRNLILGHQPRPHGGKGITGFPLHPLATFHLQIPGTDIIKDGITRHVLHGQFLRNMLPLPANHHRQLRLVVLARSPGWESLRADDRAGNLLNSTGVLEAAGWFPPRDPVVQPHTDDLRWPGHRRTELHLFGLKEACPPDRATGGKKTGHPQWSWILLQHTHPFRKHLGHEYLFPFTA